MQNELIIVIVSVILGGTITYILTRHFREKKSLAYEIFCERSLINISPKIKNKIKVEWDGAPLQDVSSFKVRLINDGNIAIKKQKILFYFEDGSRIVESDYTTKPEKEFGYVEEELGDYPPNELTFEIELMNPKDEILFNFLATESKSESLTLYAKGENLRLHKRLGPEGRWRRIMVWYSAVVIPAVICVIILKKVFKFEFSIIFGFIFIALLMSALIPYYFLAEESKKTQK